MAEMRAAVMHGVGDIRLEARGIPEPGPGEALVKVKSMGICGSDVHYYVEGRIGRYVVRRPLILGHECAGEVVGLGTGVTRLRVGDRVAVEPGATCGRCEFCKTGRYNLCPEVIFLATPPVDGAFCEYIAMPEDLLFKLPDSMSYDEGAAIEPFSVGIAACTKARVRPGDAVVVTGAGPIGLLAAVAARCYGAHPVVILDMEENRLQAARALGVTAAINIRDPRHMELARTALGGGASVAIECAGHGDAIRLGLGLLKKGGRAVLVGLPAKPEAPIDVTMICDGELELYGVFRYANSYPLAIAIWERYGLDISPIWTGRFPLSEVKQAMDTAHHEKSRHIKILIDPER